MERSRTRRAVKLKKIAALAQELNTACKSLLEISNNLRGELVKIERRRWNGNQLPVPEGDKLANGAELVKSSLPAQIMRVRALVEEFRLLYSEGYQHSLDHLLGQSSEAALIRDGGLSRLFNELGMLSGRLAETRQKLDNVPPVEKARVLVGHFSRMSHYLFLLHETSQQIVDNAVLLESRDE